ncbi:MAG: extracellular solute-binding protein [Candidatus Spyradenecus sp.]
MKRMTWMLCAWICAWAVAAHAERLPGPDYREGPDPDASPYAQPGGTLNYAGHNPPKSLNAYLDNNTFSMMIFGMLYPTMLAIDSRTGDYGPSLADWWEISEDKLSYTFHIDARAKWSDGSPVTAHDVKATFDAVMAPKSLSGQYKVLFAALESPVVLDERTIRFPCKEVHWRNLNCLGGSLNIMPKKLLDAAKEKCRREGKDEELYFNEINFDLPIVGGPYVIAEHKEGLSITLKRRPDWWCFSTPGGRGVYNFEQIKIRFFMDQNNAYEAFKKGDVDVFAVYSARVWNTESVGERFEKNWVVKQNVHNHEPIGFQGLVMNMRRAPYDDLRVRKALTNLFDRRRMVRDLMYNAYFMIRSYCSDLYDAAHPCETPLFEYDPDEAMRLFTEAGFKLNPQTGKLERNGQPFVVRILTRSANDSTYLALYKESLERLGIGLEITQKDFATWMREVGNYNFDITVSAFSGSLFRDPEAMWSSRYVDEPNGVNHSGFKNAKVDALIEAQKTEFSAAKRNDMMREIDQEITHAVPYILSWNTDSTRLLYWNKFGTPNSILGKYGDELSVPTYWWFDADSARELEQAMKEKLPLPGRTLEVYYDEVSDPVHTPGDGCQSH